jgi:hypothetical protein
MRFIGRAIRSKKKKKQICKQNNDVIYNYIQYPIQYLYSFNFLLNYLPTNNKKIKMHLTFDHCTYNAF